MRELVRGTCGDWAVSIRTACGAIGFDRSTFHYKSGRADQAAVEKRIKEIRRELGVSRKTVRKVIRSGVTEFSYERTVQPQPKIGPWRDELDRLLARMPVIRSVSV
jgi:hypothetical protein